MDLVCNLLDRALPGESPIAAVEHGGGCQGEPSFLCRSGRNVPDIEADFVTDLTNGERPGDPPPGQAPQCVGW